MTIIWAVVSTLKKCKSVPAFFGVASKRLNFIGHV
jgi:hypothetical protein